MATCPPVVPISHGFGEWTTLRDLRKGAIFENRTGVRAVKSEYTYSNGGACQCVLLESGAYAHFTRRDDEEVREIVLSATALAPRPADIRLVSVPEVPGHWGIVEEGPNGSRVLRSTFEDYSKAVLFAQSMAISAYNRTTYRIARMSGR